MFSNSLLIKVISTLLILHQQRTFTEAASDTNGKDYDTRVVISPTTQLFYLDNYDTKSLTCQLQGTSPSSFGPPRWTGPNSRDNFQQLREKFTVDESQPRSSVLEINPNLDNIDGVYYCQAKHENGTLIFNSVTVKKSILKFEDCEERQSLKFGDTSSIKCKISKGAAQADLTKTPNNNQSRYKVDDSGILINGPVISSDAGEYTIKLRLTETGITAKKTIKVGVLSTPVLDGFHPTSYQVKEGDGVTLLCNVSSSPKPTIFWRGPRERILSPPVVEGYSIKDGSLVISHASREFDHGLFNCKATNGVGGTELNISVSVLAPPGQPSILVDGYGNKSLPDEVISPYSNGFVFRIEASKFDVGDRDVGFTVKYSIIDNSSSVSLVAEQNVKSSDSPVIYRLSSLEPNQRYRIDVQAVNFQGTSNPTSITVITKSDMPNLPEDFGNALAWFTEPSTSTVIAILASALVILILVDLVFCICYHMGVSYSIRHQCCPPKTSVIGDKLVSTGGDPQEHNQPPQ